jgi:alpha-glucosidase
VDDYPGDRLFVAEALVNGPERLARYVRPDELHTAFNFTFMHESWDAGALRDVVDATLASLAPTGAPATWALSSHDEVRPVTRLGRSGLSETDLEVGTRRARAAALLSLALPGCAYVYQGDELGLAEVEDLPDDVLRDPVFVRTGGAARGRDGCRVPLPWSGEHPPYGFTGRALPWLPQPAGWRGLTVQTQTADAGSTLELYRSAIRLRADFRDETDFAWLGDADGLLDFRRGQRLRCVLNLSGATVDLPGTPTLWSGDGRPNDRLPTDTACWFVT